MPHLSTSQVRSAAAALAAAVLVLAAGCGRNSGPVPSGFVPGGPFQGSWLTVEMVVDSVDSVTSIPSVRLRVYDPTPADGFQLYRQLPGQGFDDLSRAPVQFEGSLNRGFELYEAIDHDWQAARGAAYLARGKTRGIETAAAPTTNIAYLVGADSAKFLAPGDLQILCPPGDPTNPTKVDSIPVLKWQPVTGAVRYLVRMERIDHRLFFYGFTPDAASSSYQIGSGLGTVLHEFRLSLNSFFDWTVDAIDLESRVIARSSTHRIEVRSIAEDSLTFCTP